MKLRFQAAASEEEAPDYTPTEEGEIITKPTRDMCLKCHNEESPAYEPFCFHEFQKKIRHINPLKPRTDEEKAALEACSCPTECVCVEEERCSK